MHGLTGGNYPLTSANVRSCTLEPQIKNTSTLLAVGDSDLEGSSEERDRGILVDDSLTFHAQAASGVRKAFCTLGLIWLTFLTLDKNTLPLLFKMMSGPILEYGNCVWGPIVETCYNHLALYLTLPYLQGVWLKKATWPEGPVLIELVRMYNLDC